MGKGTVVAQELKLPRDLICPRCIWSRAFCPRVNFVAVVSGRPFNARPGRRTSR
jgi:hypothetical protein